MHKFNTSGSSGTCILRHLTAHQEKTNSLPNKSLLLLREVPHVRHPLWEEIWWWHILEGTVGTDTAHAQMQKGGYSEGQWDYLIAGFKQSKKKILIMKRASLDWNFNSFSQEWNLTRIFTLAWDWCHFHGNRWTPPNTNLLRISEHHMEEKAIRFLHYCKFGITSLKKSSSADIS